MMNVLCFLAGLKNVITVGATVDTIGTNMENIYKCVDIHAPGQVIYASRFSDDFEIVHGTSCSTPLVAGCCRNDYVRSS
ncbi:hypothetical protein BCR32DRAFT_288462 [Anaeromyces robustus]|uniref:Peptidase S8/S53 domain-containing protein n=1 Tax=Anaeromyces robustus TaxID=1754192 RepID=A0A1Y1UVP5_9FUNG|nr:hypothetical protein BCR32DRAFT_288462 [Anaeromyces robustus]|eukprot:ORX41683.1 hypothetical protein BCR32DRAFT_288462 [Anaeromyces robustus]